MENKRILYVSSELSPYLPSSHTADTSLEVPRLMQENGSEVRIFMPRYGHINERRHQLHEVIRLSGINLVINDVDQPLIIKVASVPKERLQVYFIDNQEYFKDREIDIDSEGKCYCDNDERAMFFAKGVLETIKKLNWSPDIVHVNGWMSYVLPLYIKNQYKSDPAFTDTKIVTSIFGSGFEGELDKNFCKKLEFDSIFESELEHPTYINLTKTCLKYSDGVVFEDLQLCKDAFEFAKSRKLPYFNQSADQVADYSVYADLYAQILDKE